MNSLNHVLIFAFLSLIFNAPANAQLDFDQCGYDHLIEELESKYPDFYSHISENYTKAVKSSSPRNFEIFQIPIVVHIVWKENEENIHDSLIYNQIAELNKAFRGKHAEDAFIRAEFDSLAGDVGIEFVLNDVKRVKTNVDFKTNIFGKLPKEMKFTNKGGSDAINPERLLNIWVANIKGVDFFGLSLSEIFGYAYPPAQVSTWPNTPDAPSAQEDGIVIHFRKFGRNNPNTFIINSEEYPSNGKIAVHEVGHYLGLMHTWGKRKNHTGCFFDDNLTDTPNCQRISNNDCNKNQDSCTDDDLPDMVENYMEYSAERCRVMFTHDQINVMRHVMLNQRVLLRADTTASFSKNFKNHFYPNPVPMGTNIQSDVTKTGIVGIFNLNGKKILSYIGLLSEIPTEIIEVQGMYIMSVQPNGEAMSSYKIVIN